jgi:hypothetical protein
LRTAAAFALVTFARTAGVFFLMGFPVGFLAMTTTSLSRQG